MMTGENANAVHDCRLECGLRLLIAGSAAVSAVCVATGQYTGAGISAGAGISFFLAHEYVHEEPKRDEYQEALDSYYKSYDEVADAMEADAVK